MSQTPTSRPYLYHGQERVEAMVRQVVVDKLFGVAEGPEDVPFWRGNGGVIESVELLSLLSLLSY